MSSDAPDERSEEGVVQQRLVRLTREEQLALKIGDVVWVSDHGNMKHCYEYEIKPLTQGRAVSGISLRDAKRKDYHVFKANACQQAPPERKENV